jgi:hypothetical protein
MRQIVVESSLSDARQVRDNAPVTRILCRYHAPVDGQLTPAVAKMTVMPCIADRRVAITVLTHEHHSSPEWYVFVFGYVSEASLQEEGPGVPVPSQFTFGPPIPPPPVSAATTWIRG